MLKAGLIRHGFTPPEHTLTRHVGYTYVTPAAEMKAVTIREGPKASHCFASPPAAASRRHTMSAGHIERALFRDNATIRAGQRQGNSVTIEAIAAVR